MSDQKKELLRKLKVKNVKGYHYSFQEYENGSVAYLTNNATRKLINLDKLGPELTLGYTLVKDKKRGTNKIFQSQVVRKDSSVAIIVKDLARNRVISKVSFPAVEERHNHGGPSDWDVIIKCSQDFLCRRGGELQCEANRTCKDQPWSVLCCFDDGWCWFIHGAVRPNTLRCQIVSNTPPLEGIALSRKE